MSTKDEKSKNNQYIFRHKNGSFDKVITYKTNLVQEIQKHEEAKGNAAIQNFSSKSVTDEKFEKFVELAKEAEFEVYQVMKF